MDTSARENEDHLPGLTTHVRPVPYPTIPQAGAAWATLLRLPGRARPTARGASQRPVPRGAGPPTAVTASRMTPLKKGTPRGSSFRGSESAPTSGGRTLGTRRPRRCGATGGPIPVYGPRALTTYASHVFCYMLLVLCPFIHLGLGPPGVAADGSGCAPCPIGCTCAPSSSPPAGLCDVTCRSLGLTAIPVESMPGQGAHVATLDLTNNSISQIDGQVFGNFSNLRELSLTNIGLTHVAADTFSTVPMLQVIDISSNLLSDLVANIFDNLPLLSVFSAGDNPWHCDCTLAWFHHWLSWQQAEELNIPDDEAIICQSPTQMRGRQLLKVNLNEFECDLARAQRGSSGSIASLHRSKREINDPVDLHSVSHCGLMLSNFNWIPYYCDPAFFMSCAAEIYSDYPSVIHYDVILGALSPLTLSECRLRCFRLGDAFAAQVVNSFSTQCACGQVAPSNESCVCLNFVTEPEPESGSPICGRAYLPGAVSVAEGIQVTGLRPWSSRDDVILQLDRDALRGEEFTWDLSHQSLPLVQVTTTDGILQQSVPIAGAYNLTLAVTSENGTAVFVLPLHVLDPITLEGIRDGNLATEQPSYYADIEEPLQLALRLQTGSDVSVRWTRADPGGDIRVGKHCPSGWQFFHARCLQLHLAEAEIFEAARNTCISENAFLLEVHNERQMLDAIRDLAVSASGVFLGASLEGSGPEYTWMTDGQDTFFTQANVSHISRGPCVTLTDTGLTAADCSASLPYICQKDPVDCVYGGTFYDVTEQCYLAASDEHVTWDEAVAMCTQFGGHLVTVGDSGTSAFLDNALTASTDGYWVGLADRTLEGLYIWQDGRGLGGHSDWPPGGPHGHLALQDCVALVWTQEGDSQWQSLPCNESRGYVCQYKAGDYVQQVQVFAAGSVQVAPSGGPSTTLQPMTSPVSIATRAVTHLIPGAWFSQSGDISTWLVDCEALQQPAPISLQVYRPVCPSGAQLLPPGCGPTPLPYSLCTTNPSHVTDCPLDKAPDCDVGQQYCPLSESCRDLARPCSCEALPQTAACLSIANMLLSESYFANDVIANDMLPGYELLHQVTVEIPPGSDQQHYRIFPGNHSVSVYDVIGYQYPETHRALCQPVDSDPWMQHVVVDFNITTWSAVGDIYNISEGMVTNSAVCHLMALSTAGTSIQAPRTLVDRTTLRIGTFTFTAHARNDISAAESQVAITMQRAVKEFSIHFWTSDSGIFHSVSAEKPGGVIHVEAESRVTLVLYILQGTNAQATWSLTDEHAYFSELCPALVSQTPICGTTDGLFQVLQYTFPVGDPSEAIGVNISAFNNVSVEQLAFSVIAVEKLRGDGVLSRVPTGAILPGQLVTFTASVEGDSNALYNWTFADVGVASAKSDPTLRLVFNSSGNYSVKVTAYNVISYVVASTYLVVHSPANVSDLELRGPAVVTPGSVFSLAITFRVASWAAVTVTIDFGDGVGDVINRRFPYIADDEVDVILNEIHPYGDVGNYTVTVTVCDDFTGVNITIATHVDVRKSIQSVAILGLPYVATTRRNVTLQAATEGGTGPFYYIWTFQGSNITIAASSSAINHVFTTTGNYFISVLATNNISDATAGQPLQVQTTISDVTLASDSPTVLGNVTSFNASVTSGSHVEYVVDFRDLHKDNYAASQWVHSYQRTGTFNVSVLARNAVSEQTTSLLVYVIDETSIYIVSIIAPSCVASGESAMFIADVISGDPSGLTYKWNFGDGTGLTVNRVTANMSHTYLDPRNYTIELIVTNRYRNTAYIQTQCAQQVIVIDRVNTNNPLALPTGGQVIAVATILLTSGTDYSAIWQMDDGYRAFGPSLVLSFTEPGRYTANVTVANGVNSETRDLTFEVFHLLQTLDINSTAIPGEDALHWFAATGANYSLRASVVFEANMSYMWESQGSIRDGSTFEFVSATAGVFVVDVTASNPVSAVDASITVFTQDEITGLEINGNASDVTLTSSYVAVLFEVTITTGTDVTYSFSRCPDNCEFPFDVTDKVLQRFNDVGKYNVTVTAENDVSMASAVATVTVIGTMDHLQILVNGSVGTVDLAVYKPVIFSSQPQGLHLYRWSLVDASSQAVVAIDTQPSWTYTFTELGVYNLELVGGNSRNNVTTTVVLHVLEEITSLVLSSDLIGDRFGAVSQPYHFQISKMTGTNVTLRWRTRYARGLPSNWIAVTSPADKFVQLFNQLGDAQLTVEAENSISLMTAQLDIVIENTIRSFSIDILVPQPPCVALQVPVFFQARHETYWPVDYKWQFSDTRSPYTSMATLAHVFQTRGSYNVTLTLHNDVSAVTSQQTVHVQEPVTGVRLNPKEKAILAGDDVTFIVTKLTGSDVLYLWDFGDDGGDMPLTTEPRMNHTYLGGGQFKALVTAYNNVSSDDDGGRIYVTEAVSGLYTSGCCQTALALNEVSRLEAHARRGSMLSFNWTLHDGVSMTFNGNVIEYTFTALGNYDLGVTAYNSLGYETLWQVAWVQEKLNAVGIHVDSKYDDVYIDEELEFRASVSGGGRSDVTYHWWLTGGAFLREQVGPSDTFAMTFTRMGTFSVSVMAINNVSNVFDVEVVEVRGLECDPPDLMLIGDIHRFAVRSARVSLEVVSESCDTHAISHHWDIYSGSCDDPNLGPADAVDLPSWVDTYTRYLSLPPRTLDYGRYCCRLSSSFRDIPGTSSLQLSLFILQSDLRAIIRDGSEVVKGVGADIRLDGTLSYDPDMDDATSVAALRYEWTCASWTEHGLGTLGDTPATVPCFSPISDAVVVLPASSLRANHVYNITLTVGDSSRQSAMAVQKLVTTAYEVPTVSIDCVSCREDNLFTVGWSQTVKLLGKCHNCPGLDILYYWRVIRDDGQELALEDVRISRTGPRQVNLVIRKEALLDKHEYTFVLNVKAPGFLAQGQAALHLGKSTPPSHGACVIVGPDVVMALRDKVSITCSGWVDHSLTNSPLQYSVYVNNAGGEHYPIYTGTRNQLEFYLSPFEAHEEDVYLYVEVADSNNIKTLAVEKIIRVTSLQANEDGSRMHHLRKEINDKIAILQYKNDHKDLLQYIITLLLQLNGETLRGLVADAAERTDMRAVILRVMKEAVQAKINTVDDGQRVAYALRLITSYIAEFPQTSSHYKSVLNLLEETLTMVSRWVSQAWEGQEFVPGYLLATLSNLMRSMKTDYWTLVGGVSTSLSSTSDRDLKSLAERKILMENATLMADQTMSLVLQTQVAMEHAYHFESEYVDFTGARLHSSASLAQYSNHGNRITYPEDLLTMRFENQEFFDVVSDMTSNPFLWGDLGDRINSRVIGILLTYPNGTAFEFHDLPEDSLIEIAIKRGHDQQNRQLQNKGAPERSKRDASIELDGIITSTSPVGSTTAEQIPTTVPPGNDNSLTLNRDELTDVPVVLYPGQTLSTYVTIPVALASARVGFTMSSQIARSNNESEEYREVSTPRVTSNKYVVTAYFAADYVPHRFRHDYAANLTFDNDSTGTGQNYTVMVPYGTLTTGSKKSSLSLTNASPDVTVHVTLGVFHSTCKYFHVGAVTWLEDGCTVGNASTSDVTVCLCNHLSYFSAAVALSPTDLDFQDLLQTDFSYNPVVIATVGVLAGLFLVGLLVARRWDQHDKRRLASIPLCGKDGPFLYEVTVVTGRRPGAGTSAHVSMTIEGLLAKSGARHLFKAGAFKRDSSDVMLVATETYLGDIAKVEVWHDNAGLSPSWYLSRVVIRDLQTHRKYYFIADRWLSLLHKDGSIHESLCAAASEELRAFRTVFRAQLSRGFSDHHVWVSTVDRPARHPYTRVQRVTACATFVFLYLFLNAMWFGLLRGAPSEYETLTGRSSFSWLDLLVGFMASLTLFPVTLVVTAMFRRSRAKAGSVAQMRPQADQTVEMDALVNISSRESSAHMRQSRLLHGEDTAESVFMHPGRLHRTAPLRAGVGDHPAGLLSRDLSDVGSVATTSSRDDASRTAPQAWWSYEGILAWPEQLPGYGDSDSRQTSASSFSPHHRPSLVRSRRQGKDSMQDIQARARRRSLSRRMSITDSIGDILEDLEDKDPWETSDTASASTSTKETCISGKDSLSDCSSSKSKPTKSFSINGATGKTTAKKSITRAKGSDIDVPTAKTGTITQTKSVARQRDEDAAAPREATLDELLAEFESDQLLQGPISEAIGHRSERRSRTSSSSSEQSTSVSSTPQHGGMSRDRRRSVISTLVPVYPMLRDQTWSTVSGWTDGATSLSAPPAACSRGRRCLLPTWWCMYVAYVLCVLLSSMAIILTLIYGHTFGPDLALRWLVACLISLTLSAFLFEPIKIVVIALFIATVKKTLEEEITHVEEFQPTLDTDDKYKGVRPKPLAGYALQSAREEAAKLRRLRVIIRQACAYLLIIVIVMMTCYGYHDDKAFLTYQHMRDVFIEAPNSNTNISFHGIRNVSDIWDWLLNTAAPGLHRDHTDVAETSGFLMGVARLRQLRSTQITCSSHDVFQRMSADHVTGIGCHGDPDWRADQSSYDAGWVEATNGTWIHSSVGPPGSSPFITDVDQYYSGGYVVPLGSTLQETVDVIQGLIAANWIDRGSRAVFLEWVSYYSNVHLYAVASLVLEIPVSGGVLSSESVYVSRFLQPSPDSGLDAMLLLQVLISIGAIYLVVHVILSVAEEKKCYFRSGWNWLEMAVTILALCSTCLYIAGVINASSALAYSATHRREYTNMRDAGLLDYSWQCVNAVLLFLLMILVSRQVRFIRGLSIASTALHKTSPAIMACALIMAIILVAYSSLGFLWYGQSVYSFRGVGQAIGGLCALLRGTGGPTLDAMWDVNRSFTTVFVLTLMALTLTLVCGLLLAALVSEFKVTKSARRYCSTLDMQDYEMVDFMMKRFKRLIGVSKEKPAFRTVKFQGVSSLSERSTSSCRTAGQPSSSGGSDTIDLDLLDGVSYLESLMDRAVSTWDRMLDRLDKVELLDLQEQELEAQLERIYTTPSTSLGPTAINRDSTIQKRPPKAPLSSSKLAPGTTLKPNSKGKARINRGQEITATVTGPSKEDGTLVSKRSHSAGTPVIHRPPPGPSLGGVKPKSPSPPPAAVSVPPPRRRLSASDQWQKLPRGDRVRATPTLETPKAAWAAGDIE